MSRIVVGSLVFSLVGGLAVAGCARPAQQAPLAGVVQFVKGSAVLVRAGKEQPLKLHDSLQQGDTLRTGEKAVVIAQFNDKAAEVEIQPNAEFRIDEFSAHKKKLALAKGNLWLRVNKQTKDEEFVLQSPTAIAGVRGTKFFTFQFKGPDGKDYHGTCHCEGSVQIKAKTGEYQAVHNRDHIVLHRDGKTALLGPKDLAFMGEMNRTHAHSILKDSALGPQVVPPSPAMLKQMIAAAEKQFNAR